MNFSIASRLGRVLALLALVLGSAVGASSQPMSAAEASRASRQVLVRVGAGGPVSAAAVHQHRRGVEAVRGARVVRVFDQVGWSLVEFDPNSFGAGVLRLRQMVGSRSVVANARVSRSRLQPETSLSGEVSRARVPNDPALGLGGWVDLVRAPAAWDVATGSRGVVVAVIDSGIDLQHPDVQANLWVNPFEAVNGADSDGNGYIDDVHGINVVIGQRNTPPLDDDGHGTHVAGLIGAVGNNGIGVAGVNWQVSLMALRFLDANGDGFVSGAIECINYVLAMKARGQNVRVINNSWTGTTFNTALRDALASAQNAGIVIVCAAGNGDRSGRPRNNDVTPTYPASYDLEAIVSVGASDAFDNPASFSNFGANTVDLAAPGVEIYSTFRNGGYGVISGTSMSAPLVAGGAALLLSREPGLTPAQIKERLLSSADRVAGWAGRSVSGGRLNLASLLQPPSAAARSLTGQVVRIDGFGTRIPLVGARVRLDATTFAWSDHRGFYRFDDLAPGVYSVSAQLSGYAFRTARVAVRLDSPSELRQDFVSSSRRSYYSIGGRVLDLDGLPVAGVSIFQAGVSAPVAITDAEGFYIIRDRNAGTYLLGAQGAETDWVAVPSPRVSLPTRGVSGAPNAVIDFEPADDESPEVSVPGTGTSSPSAGDS